VQGLSDDNDDHAIVRAIVEMGHALGSDVTAEGVEHGQQILELKALGCDSASGYLMAHPEPGDIIESVLQGGLPLISSAILNATPVRASGMGGEMGALQVSTSYEHSGAAADKSAAEVLLNLLHTSGSAGQRVSAFLTRFNLTMDELNVLMVLDEATEPLSPATVAERVIAATHRPHAVIDRLIRHALVECNGDQKVRPTTAGIALMTNLKPKLQEVEAGLFALVSEAQRSEWLRHTGALLQSINASTAPSSEPTAHGV
jgi:DNA-binding MarR family transcriptional regulator